MPKETPSIVSEREARLRSDLLDRWGPLMSGEPLFRALGFKNSAALRLAVNQERVRVQLFTPPGRRGKFAYTEDVARWLAGCAHLLQ